MTSFLAKGQEFRINEIEMILKNKKKFYDAFETDFMGPEGDKQVKDQLRNKISEVKKK